MAIRCRPLGIDRKLEPVARRTRCARGMEMALDQNAIKSMLREQGFWAALPEPVIAALAAVSVVTDFAAGSTIFLEGSQSPFFYILHRGHVGLDMHVAGRGRVRILSLGPGEMLAWSALLGDGQMTATATALEETQLISYRRRTSGGALQYQSRVWLPVHDPGRRRVGQTAGCDAAPVVGPLLAAGIEHHQRGELIPCRLCQLPNRATRVGWPRPTWHCSSRP